jgi:uncharacterized protein
MGVFPKISRGLMSVMLFVIAVAQAEATNLVSAARAQIGRTVRYDPAYRTLQYPGGDVPVETGVCADVVVRALRDGLKLDLQKLVHEDMERNFSRYPRNWGLTRPDPNIDHRRVLNLQVFFTRRDWTLPISVTPRDYQAGDLVTCTVPPHLPHIMVVSDKTNAVGRPLVIHNIGAGTQEEDRLFDFKITGHYRVKRSEPPGPAEGGQPIRSGTNRVSSAAGTRR